MSNTLKSIKDNNLTFVSAQPDETYFHWQVEIYLYQFSKHGILDQCYAVFGYRGNTPSEYGKWLEKKYPGRIHFYKDERTPEQRNYIPSIRPHVLKKFFKQYPKVGKNVFYHDSDIFMVKLPPFEKMLVDNNLSIGYLSDTVSYIGYDYITECCRRYKHDYPELPEDDLLNKMCEICGIDKNLVKSNQANAGGAQYLLKNIGAKFWIDVESCSNKMWSMFKKYETTYPIKDHIQSWTTDMWAVLWTYWGRGKKTVVDKNLEFSWGVSSVSDYNRHNIFHLAGVTSNMRNTHFYKGEFTNRNVFAEYKKNKDLFSNVSNTSATHEYVKIIKEYVDKGGGGPVAASTAKVNNVPKADRFELKTALPFGDIYRRVPKQFGGANMWRSRDNKYIIFKALCGWVLTDKIYEQEINADSGGHATNSSEEPYLDGWNIECSVKTL